MPKTTPLIKAALNLTAGAGFDVYEKTSTDDKINSIEEDGLRKILPVCDL